MTAESAISKIVGESRRRITGITRRCARRRRGRVDVLSLTEEEFWWLDGEQSQVAKDGYLLGVAIGEERLALDGLHDGVETIDAEYEREKDAERVQAVHYVVGEVTCHPGQVIKCVCVVVQHDVVVCEHDYRES